MEIAKMNNKLLRWPGILGLLGVHIRFYPISSETYCFLTFDWSVANLGHCSTFH